MCFHSSVLRILALLVCVANASASAQEPSEKPLPLSGMLAPHAAVTNEPADELARIRIQLEALARMPDAELVQGTLERGRLALEAARRALAQNAFTLAARKKQLAWAAIAAASHRLRAVEATSERAAAERRAREAEAASERERERLRAAPPVRPKESGG